MKFKLVFIILICLVFTSCATLFTDPIDDMMNSWIGASKNELLLSWGPPNQTFSDGKGGEVWTYAQDRQTMGNAWTDSYGRTYWNAPKQYQSVRQFYINENDIIYAYRWQGL